MNWTCHAAALATCVVVGSRIAAPGALAQNPVRLLLVAAVDNVYDPGDALRDDIRVGDLLRGTITYDPSARNTTARSDAGRYEWRRPPFGMLIEAGPFVFQTDPRHVDFWIEVGNDRDTPPRDSWSFVSANNRPLDNGSRVSRIAWELVDETHQALNSAALPVSAPDLRQWSSGFGLTLNGEGAVEFIVRAHITEATLCTGTMRCPSPE